jgi:hypothetical protein
MSAEKAFDWRYYAACRAHPHVEWWDEGFVGHRETREGKAERHERAIKVCDEQCVVKAECEAAIDPDRDEGVRAGRRLKPLTTPGGYGEVQGTSRRKRAS